MKALVYRGPGSRQWVNVPDPQIEDAEDAIIRVDAVTICGTDLHILKGDVPTVEAGRVLGHEAVGTITQIGSAVRTFAVGDRVLISCISSCGRCGYCREGRYGLCHEGGWRLGHLINGTQAEQVRVPFADRSLYRLPESVDDETAVLLADILPTSYEVGVRNAKVRPGDTVAIIGAGPIGLAATAMARLFTPMTIAVLDPDLHRQDAARGLGADLAFGSAQEIIDWAATGTDGGFDAVIEAVGVPETFELCAELVRPGGHLANVGVHGGPVTLHLEKLWDRDVSITTGLVDTNSTRRLLSLVAAQRLSLHGLVTHRFGLDEMQDAYDVFGDATNSQALKVVLFSDQAIAAPTAATQTASDDRTRGVVQGAK